jgi:hypothetical protein
MPDDSCDVALEECNRRKLELAYAFSTMVALAAAFAVSVFVFLAAIGILVLTLGALGTRPHRWVGPCWSASAWWRLCPAPWPCLAWRRW